jgi:hypothetical protein
VTLGYFGEAAKLQEKPPWGLKLKMVFNFIDTLVRIVMSCQGGEAKENQFLKI